MHALTTLPRRRQRELGELEGLEPKKRGRKSKPVDPLAERVRELEKEKEQLRRRLSQAEAIIDVQKKISELLGIHSQPFQDGESK